MSCVCVCVCVCVEGGRGANSMSEFRFVRCVEALSIMFF